MGIGLLSIAGTIILGFFFLSIFDKELRDKVINRLSGTFDNILKKTPVLSDKVIIDPLTEQIRKFTAGRQTGGIKIDEKKTFFGVS